MSRAEMAILIVELTREQLTAEIMAWQKTYLEARPIDELRGLIVRYRAEDHHKLLLDSAGLGKPAEAEEGGPYL